MLEENKAKQHVRNLSSHANFPGSMNAMNYIHSQFSSLGFDPIAETYYPVISTPISSNISLWIDGKLEHDANMFENISTKTSNNETVYNPSAYLSYSQNGNVTSEYIYCNYGTEEDYLRLKSNGIDIENKIHIIRYGKLDIGFKVKNAEDHHAVAVILYADSFDDGKFTEDNGYKAYPEGPARNNASIQRGSVLYYSRTPHDSGISEYASKVPTALKNLTHYRIPKIPAVPVSQREITPVLIQLNNRGVKMSKGNVAGFSYHSGPSGNNTKVNVINKQKYSSQKITNLVLEIPGVFNDREIIIGSHRDSLTVGSVGSTNSGNAVLLELARGLSKLREKGWKPLRTVKLISWDAEEAGMIGSTSYGLDHEEDIRISALVYFNLDHSITGSLFECNSHPLLNKLFLEAAKYTPYNSKVGMTLYDHWKNTSNLTFGIPSTDSSFKTFQHHFGIPSAASRFANDPEEDAVFHRHSSYDSHLWMEKYIDPDYRLHNTLTIFVGMSVLILAENELVRFEATNYMCVLWDAYKGLNCLIHATFPHEEEIIQLSGVLLHQLQLLTFHFAPSFDKFANLLRTQTTRDYPWWQALKKFSIYSRLASTNQRFQDIDKAFLNSNGSQQWPCMTHSVFSSDQQENYNNDILPELHQAIKDKDYQRTIEWLRTLSIQYDRAISLLTV